MEENDLKLKVNEGYNYAKKAYAAFGVDTDEVMSKMKERQVSLHCWQGDDVNGFEVTAAGAGGGILSTGNYPGNFVGLPLCYKGDKYQRAGS